MHNTKQEVLRLLTQRGKSFSAAESCTGGLIAKMFTDLPGASRAFVGGVVFLVLYRPWPLLIDLDLPGILALGGMVICGTLMAHPLYLQGVNDIGPVKASMLASVEPVAATVLSVVWLKSDFVFMDFIGFVCIIATVFVLAKADSEKASPESVESAGDTL